MIGLFYVLSIILVILGGLFAIVGVLESVEKLKNLQKSNDTEGVLWGPYIIFVAIVFVCAANYMVDLDITINDNYKIGEETAYKTFNETEYNCCVEYTDINDYKLFPENRSVYCYCKGYINAFENEEEYIKNKMIKENLSM